MYFKFNNNIIIYKTYEFKYFIFNFFSGKFDEDFFKIIRLQNGFYRQRLSYMLRISIPYGHLNINQINLISYISFKYDKKYIHLTTRTNIQLNWIKLIDFFNILNDLNFLNLNSIQTSGNCIRNITNSQYSGYSFYESLDSKSWSELIKQWYYLNYNFLLLPRKFKIVILNTKIDKISFKIHDMGLNIKKNNFNNLYFNILIGGGMGRNPIKGSFIFFNIHWINIIKYCDCILKFYNYYSIRNNLYKSRIKILFKNINKNLFYLLIKYDYLYLYNNNIYLINEKEINKFFLFYNKNLILFFNNNCFKFFKKIKYNIFFLNWIKNILHYSYNLYKFSIIEIPIKNYSPPGDIPIFYIKLILYLSLILNLYYINFTNRQNIVFNNLKNNFIFFFYKKLKNYFFNIFNLNFLTDIISCPGYDFCSLANSKSIDIYNLINKFFTNFKDIFFIKNISINISGCINSCSHHHISNIGLVGVNKNFNEFYQLYLGGNHYYNLKLSKIFSSSYSKKNIIYIINKLIKFYLYINFNNEVFYDTYNRFEIINFKKFIFNNNHLF